MQRLAQQASSGLTVLMLLGTMVVGAQAQVTWSSTDDCKCVDADGKEIENCVCIVTGGEGTASWQFAPYGQSKARMGITLSITVDEGEVRGPKVESVLEDGPADKAGIQEGDIITHIDGHSVFEALPDPEAEDELDLDSSVPTQRLLYLARRLDPGQEVEIRYDRDGESRTTTLVAEELDDWGTTTWTLGENMRGPWGEMAFPENWRDKEGAVFYRSPKGFQFRTPGGEGNVLFWDDEDEEGPRAFFRRFGESGRDNFSFYAPKGEEIEFRRGMFFDGDDYLTSCPGASDDPMWTLGFGCIGGLKTQELKPELGTYFGTDEGVLVLDVHEDSRLGVHAGDVILKVGDRTASDSRSLNRILRSYEPYEEITLTIMRKSREMSVSGMLGR